MSALVPVLALFALTPAQAPDGDEADKPLVEILQSNGALDGPAESAVAVPRWERLRLELRVENRLPAEITDLEVEVALVSSAGAADPAASVIPGWSFRETRADVIPALDDAYLRILRELPARRSSPPADEIAYRAHIKSYRLASPELETALRLLGSSHASDQLAALKSFELAAEDRDARAIAQAAAIARALARALETLPADPSPSDALRMAFAVRALGTVGDASEVHTLLELPARLDAALWARAVGELAARMVGASDADAPRLRVLPTWAKEPRLFAARSPGLLEDLVRDAILRMGDTAVPSLLAEAHLGPAPEVRARAQRLLHALGRATVRSQLALRDRAAKLQVIDVLGRIGAADPVRALVEVLGGRDAELRRAARRAIERIGAEAVDPLVESLGTPSDEELVDVLGALGPDARRALERAAARYGVARSGREDDAALVSKLRARLYAERRARLVSELERALELGREGSFTESFRLLDGIFTQDAELYMSYATPIAETYLARARRLFAAGDYDAAVQTLRTGQSVVRLPAAEALLLEAQHALARGYLELGDLDRAEELLEEADPQKLSAETRTLASRTWSAKAERALAGGDYGKARAMIDRARSLKLEDPELELIHRRLLFAENVAIVAVLGLFVPAILLALVLVVRRRLQAAKLARLERALDRAPNPTSPKLR